ncbi:MAG: ribosome silencing factor [Deltaproteobacteria bacterium]|nr:ribosome silencing factor [Deltaproteobacteria bacterium]
MQVARWALDKKALDVVVLDVRGLSSYADYIVLATAESEPQLNAIADRAEEGMKERGERPLGIEGAGAGRWLLLDFGDVVLHAFYQDAREFYDLEGLWADAPRVPVVDKP